MSECREASYALSETQASAAAASVDSTVQGTRQVIRDHLCVCAWRASHTQTACKRDWLGVELTADGTRQVSSSTCEAMQGEMALAAAAGDALEQQLQDCDTSAGARGEALAAAVGEQEEAVAQYALAAQAQLGYIRAHELKLRQDEVTGSTPMKKDFELPPALPAFRCVRCVCVCARAREHTQTHSGPCRRDSEVIAEFRGHPLPEMSSTSPLELVATTVTVDAESAQDSPLAHEMEDPVAPDDSKAAAETSAAAEMEAAAAAQEEAAEAERAQAAAAAAAAAQKQKQQEEDAAAAAAEKAEKAAVVPRLAAKTNNTAREIQVRPGVFVCVCVCVCTPNARLTHTRRRPRYARRAERHQRSPCHPRPPHAFLQPAACVARKTPPTEENGPCRSGRRSRFGAFRPARNAKEAGDCKRRSASFHYMPSSLDRGQEPTKGKGGRGQHCCFPRFY